MYSTSIAKIALLVWATLLMALPLLGQKYTADRYVNRENPVPFSLILKDFFYHLEEGKQSPNINMKEGIEIPEDSLRSWACFYRKELTAGFFTGAQNNYITYSDINSSGQDSVFAERWFLELNAMGDIQVHFVVRFISLENKVVHIEFLKNPEPAKDLSASQILAIHAEDQKYQFLAEPGDLLPPPPLPGISQEEAKKEKEAEKKRHQQAVQDFECEN